jgi:hypothetical protein
MLIDATVNRKGEKVVTVGIHDTEMQFFTLILHIIILVLERKVLLKLNVAGVIMRL